MAFICLNIALIIAFFCLKAAKQSLIKIFIYSSLIAVLVSFYIYWVKAGGFIPTNQKIIFGSKSLIDFTTYIFLPTNTLAVILSASRLLFPLFVLIDAIKVNYNARNFFEKRKYLYFALALPMIVLFVITLPSNFMNLFAYNFRAQSAMVLLVNAILVIYILLAVALYLFELFGIRLSWYKQRHKYLMASMFATILQFLYFWGFEPVSVFQDYNKIYYISTFLKYTSTNSITIWIAVLTICILTTALALWQLIKYMKFDYDRNKQELVISKAISGATTSISTIVHGIKNQIIASKILSENAMDALESKNAEEAIKNIGKLKKINDTIMTRMDYLYKSFKTMKSVLVLAKVSDVMDNVKAKVGNMIPIEQISYNVIDEMIIADVELLSEAVYNFVLNAFEAVPLSKDPEIKVDTYTTRAHLVITIEDNGCGISKSVQEKLFEPFVSSKNSDTNWGLGLCNARKIVISHLGYVRFETTENVGTKFYIVLPIYKQKKENRK